MAVDSKTGLYRFFKVIRGSFISLAIMILLSGCGGSNQDYNISGRIIAGGAPLSGVTVTLSGDAAMTAKTDISGNFTFNSVPGGTFTVTPSITGYSFVPSSRPCWLNGIDGTGFNFSAIFQGRLAATTHTVFLKDDGSVWAWGNNANGQLGNGTTTNSTTPVQVSGLSGVTAIAGGHDHTLALKSDGTVWAWGNNSNGQLGDGSVTQRTAPVNVSGLTDVKSIAAGNGYTVALKNDGTVWAWGSNNNGQLGNGTTTNSITPVQVSNLRSVTSVAAGYDYTIALISDGSVWAWGNNSNGQLGNGTTTNTALALPVNGLSGVVSIAAGYYHSVVLRSTFTNYTVWTWGSNSSGQLGIGNTTDQMTPTRVGGTLLTNITAIAAGLDHTLALADDGRVWSWGNNSNGQLGDGTTVSSATPVRVGGGLTGIAAIAGGNKYSVALRIDNAVWTWGNNSNGQLGNGTTTDTAVPVQVP